MKRKRKEDNCVTLTTGLRKERIQIVWILTDFTNLYIKIYVNKIKIWCKAVINIVFMNKICSLYRTTQLVIVIL